MTRGNLPQCFALGGFFAFLLLVTPALGQEAVIPEQWLAENQDATPVPQPAENLDVAPKLQPAENQDTAPEPQERPAVGGPSIPTAGAPAGPRNRDRDWDIESAEDDESKETLGGTQSIGIWGILGDTPAQWLMAVSGVVATCISIAALCLIRKTLVATRRTLAEARRTTRAAVRAAAAAEESVEETRKTAKRELRAYMSLVPAGMSFGVSPGGRLIVHISQRNSGQTPARNVQLSWAVKQLPNPLPPDHAFPQTVPTPGTNVVHAGDKFSVSTTVDIILSDLWADPPEGCAPLRVYVFAILSYLDAFDEPRKTWACWSYDRDRLYQMGERAERGAVPTKVIDMAFEFTDAEGHNKIT